MQSEKKKLLKNFKILIEDLLDNYDEYTDKEKQQVKELFSSVCELNNILEKYDIEVDFAWQEYFNTVQRYFGAN
jgi:hypothetical protein